jgi:hypothetical protein
MHIYVDHCAILVENLEISAATVTDDCHHGKIHTFASEGTREMYIWSDRNKLASILLMQAEGNGPYLEALKKRGPGLHHVCIRVDDIHEFVADICGSGFLLHPASLKTVNHGTVFLCRPGIPFLVEVMTLSEEQRETHARDGLVTSIGATLDDRSLQIVKKVFGDYIYSSQQSELTLNRHQNRLFGIRDGNLCRL